MSFVKGKSTPSRRSSSPSSFLTFHTNMSNALVQWLPSIDLLKAFVQCCSFISRWMKTRIGVLTFHSYSHYPSWLPFFPPREAFLLLDFPPCCAQKPSEIEGCGQNQCSRPPRAALGSMEAGWLLRLPWHTTRVYLHPSRLGKGMGWTSFLAWYFFLWGVVGTMAKSGTSFCMDLLRASSKAFSQDFSFSCCWRRPTFISSISTLTTANSSAETIISYCVFVLCWPMLRAKSTRCKLTPLGLGGGYCHLNYCMCILWIRGRPSF